MKTLLLTIILSTCAAFFVNAQPANNNCADAQTLTVGAVNVCTNTAGTNTGSTYSGELPAPGCGTYNGSDVWYKVTVPQNGNIVAQVNTSGSGSTDMAIAFYSGTCGSLTLIECDDDDGADRQPLISLTGQTMGETLYIRVWDYQGNEFGAFTICAYSFNLPANNNCADAQMLTVGADEVCTYTVGSNIGATNSGETPIPISFCANYKGGDVWYKVTVPQSGNLAAQIITDGTGQNMGMAFYSGTCGSLALIECDDDNGLDNQPLINLTGQTMGDTLYIRVWEDRNNDFVPFNICVFDYTTPTNDTCAGATMLTVDTGCTKTIGSNRGATDSGETPAPGCEAYNGGDVWYKVTVPPSGNVAAETKKDFGPDDLGMAFYSGTCGSLALIACDDDDGTDYHPFIGLTGRTVGETLYIRVWERGNNRHGLFKICAHQSGTSLPLEFADFTATLTGPSTVLLEWSTYSEENNSYFVVERSTDDINWSTIGQVTGAGTTATPQNYSFTDNLTVKDRRNARIYYRLKQVNFDGEYQYSIVRSVSPSLTAEDGLRVYPNPAKHHVALTVSYNDLITAITVYDVQGRLVLHHPGNNTQYVDLNISQLSPGMYFIRVIGKRSSASGKFVVN